jgi:hypothetical protein
MSNNIFKDEFLLIPNQQFKSKNQALVGPPNPKTLIQPIMHPRITDIDYWRYSGLTSHSHINSQSPWDTINSGYERLPKKTATPESVIHIGNPGVINFNNFLNNPDMISSVEDFSIEPETFEETPDRNVVHLQHSKIDSKNKMFTKSKNSYRLNNREKNLHTQNVQPNVYTYNDVIEPISSNLGISFTPEFTPSSFITKSGIRHGVIGDPNYINHDGLGGNYSEKTNLTMDSVYDPRFTGNGSSNRGFSHPVTGAVDFYYDDVDSIRKPNYIIRNNIEFAEYASSSGALTDLSHAPSLEDIKDKANDTFLQATLQQRDELMERLMRKRNAEMAEKRKFPKHTM